MNKKYKIKFKNYEEIIIILIFSLFISLIVSIWFSNNYIATYSSLKFNSDILSLFGILLGLLITAYTILFGLIPALDKEVILSNLLVRINKVFLVTFMVTFSVFITALVIDFIYLTWFILLQLFLILLALGLLFFVSLILYSLFELTRKSAKKRFQSVS